MNEITKYCPECQSDQVVWWRVHYGSAGENAQMLKCLKCNNEWNTVPKAEIEPEGGSHDADQV